MTALHMPVPEAVMQRDAWVTCPTDELLSVPWREALGVHWMPSGWTTWPTPWRWTLQLGRDELVVSTCPTELRASSRTLTDLELSYLLARAELGSLTHLRPVLHRRWSSGARITWTEGPEPEMRRTGTHPTRTLQRALDALGLVLVSAQVRPDAAPAPAQERPRQSRTARGSSAGRAGRPDAFSRREPGGQQY